MWKRDGGGDKIRGAKGTAVAVIGGKPREQGGANCASMGITRGKDEKLTNQNLYALIYAD